jgi:hypothetical protein
MRKGLAERRWKAVLLQFNFCVPCLLIRRRLPHHHLIPIPNPCDSPRMLFGCSDRGTVLWAPIPTSVGCVANLRTGPGGRDFVAARLEKTGAEFLDSALLWSRLWSLLEGAEKTETRYLQLR